MCMILCFIESTNLQICDFKWKKIKKMCLLITKENFNYIKNEK